METIVRWKTGVFHADPKKCYEEIVSIGEEVTPEQVLKKAEDQSTELNKCFTWTDSVAAQKWRRYEAVKVMNSLIVIVRPDSDENNEPTQFRLLMKNEKTEGTGYKQVVTMIRDEDEYSKLLKQAYAELQAFKAKYSCLSELSAIISLIP